MTPHLAEPPIFVVGVGRSGTTLLQSLLSAHPRLAVTPETHFCGIWGRRAAQGFEAAWEGYLASPRFADLGVAPERARAILASSPERTPRAALAALLAAYGEARGRPRVGEKTPGHRNHVRTLLEWFPDARVIVTRRDPRAFVASKLKAPWAARYVPHHGTALRRVTRLHMVAEDARLWARVYGELAPALLRDPRVTMAPYEALVGDPEGVVRGLCDFLGEAFEPAMLGDRAAQAAADAPGSEAAWGGWTGGHLAAARRPVNAASLDKWRGELTPREVAVIEALAGEAMARCGYEPASGAAERRAARRLAGAATAAGAVELAARGAVAGVARRLRG